MSTLKRKNANGVWEYIQVTGQDVSQLQSDIDSVTTAMAINHTFNHCHIDYNKQGVQLNNNRFRQVIFTGGCWIEGSNTPPNEANPAPFIQVDALGTVKANHIMVSNCFMFPKNKTADTLFKGKMTITLRDTSIDVNRFPTSGDGATLNYGSGAVLCDDNVVVASTTGTMWHDNPMVISRNQALNANSDFETDANGATTFTGFTKSSGTATGTIDTGGFYSGTKSLKIDGTTGTSYVLDTEIVPIRGAERVLGQARIYLPASSPKVTVTTSVTFYADDKTTVIGSAVVMSQDMDYTASGTGDRWFALKVGSDASPTLIPPKATYVKFRVNLSNIPSAVLRLDDMIIAKM
jgi:hypothetical protein